jgi:phosphoribosylformimino-5-aminoimidazole carboxamide ribotide isomerase
MQVIPALDIMNGHCVRLYQGDFAKQTTYDADPAGMAARFAHKGAEWLHLVDLDGARDPENRQLELITHLIADTGLSVQVGGGIRSADDIKALLDAGAARVVIGSLGVRDISATKDLIAQFGSERICIAADVRADDDGIYRCAVSGWTQNSDISLFDLLRAYDGSGLKHVLCTDINRDGAMQGVNAALYADIARSCPELALQASGGIASIQDLYAVDGTVAGVVIGKALYEGQFTLSDALEAAA